MSEVKFEDVFDIKDSIGFLPYWSDARVRYCANAIQKHDKLTEENKLLREALSNLVLTSHENEERLADRLYRDFYESDALMEAKELLGRTC